MFFDKFFVKKRSNNFFEIDFKLLFLYNVKNNINVRTR